MMWDVRLYHQSVRRGRIDHIPHSKKGVTADNVDVYIQYANTFVVFLFGIVVSIRD